LHDHVLRFHDRAGLRKQHGHLRRSAIESDRVRGGRDDVLLGQQRDADRVRAFLELERRLERTAWIDRSTRDDRAIQDDLQRSPLLDRVRRDAAGELELRLAGELGNAIDDGGRADGRARAAGGQLDRSLALTERVRRLQRRNELLESSADPRGQTRQGDDQGDRDGEDERGVEPARAPATDAGRASSRPIAGALDRLASAAGETCAGQGGFPRSEM